MGLERYDLKFALGHILQIQVQGIWKNLHLTRTICNFRVSYFMCESKLVRLRSGNRRKNGSINGAKMSSVALPPVLVAFLTVITDVYRFYKTMDASQNILHNLQNFHWVNSHTHVIFTTSKANSSKNTNVTVKRPGLFQWKMSMSTFIHIVPFWNLQLIISLNSIE